MIIIILLLIILFILCTTFKTEHLNDISNTEMVIARYNENLEWINAEPFNKYKHIIYNKGPNNNFITNDKTIEINKIDNVGRESHTYLYHVINNYNNLADITIFLPGSSNLPHKLECALKIIDKINETNNSCFLLKTENLYEEFKDFSMDEYMASDLNNKSINNESKLTPEKLRPFGIWYKHHFGDAVVNHYTYFGIFSIHKKHILQHPKSYYEELVKELEVSSNPEVGHYYERGWAAVFGPIN